MSSNLFRHVINKIVIVSSTRTGFGRQRTIYQKASQQLRTLVVGGQQTHSKNDQKILR